MREEEEEEEDGEKVQMSTYSMLVALQRDKRVLSMKDQIELLEQMEQDLKSIDKEIDPFQKQLLNEAMKLDINESQINEKKIEILKSMTDELEANFHNVNLSDDRKKSQKDVLKEIAQIHQELGKHDVENALQNEFELIEKETEKNWKEHEEKKENLMKKKKAEVKALKERLKEFRYVVKPKVEISEPKHPYDFLKNVEFSVAVKPGGENFYNIQEDFFEQYVNYNEKPQLFAKPNEEDSALFGEKIKSIGAEGKNCVILKNFVKKAIYNGSKDYTTEVLRARLGAQALSSVLNGKRFSTDLAYAVLASLAGAGSIAYVLDTFVWPALLLVLHITQPHSFLFMIVSCILNSLTALFGETFDSGVIKKFLDTLKGGSFLPASWKEAIALLKDSAIAGGVAAVGSIPLNLIVMFNSWYLMPVAAIANQIATSTAGAMIPMEISKMQRFTKAAFLLKTQSGFYAKPTKNSLKT
uniref:Uncharacterized protein n=1 Tax=Ditylenchus dipsaci TaxID=166011 RepID=A0A915EHS3_9BILA